MPLEECLGEKFFDPFSIVFRSAFMNYPTWTNNLESSFLDSDPSAVDKRPLVLAVDDNHDNLELLTQILDLFGCECVGAVDGYAAISAAVDRPPDLIVLDICLPDIDGIEVVKRIQQNPELRHIPIVAVTALAKAEDRDRILNAGCVEYISKPFNIKDLEIIIRQHLNSQMLLVEF
ncbi:response regulator [Microcoleus sp. K4-B3]|uniref:response regulator n=2 Tax=unclassified Microcoleus TaxID=2642155 RepID=UPI002FD0F525